MDDKLIDKHVGQKIRERRILLGLTQQQLAELIGVTYQQAHKYERGINRVSAGRLFNISKALGVSVGYFFEGIGDKPAREFTLRQRMCLDIARNFSMIREVRYQEALSQMVRALAENDAPIDDVDQPASPPQSLCATSPLHVV